MRKSAAVILSLILCSVSLWATSTTQPAPQTARQALIDMFFCKEPGTLIKHLPAVTRAALEQSGALATVQAYSGLAGQFQTQGRGFQTFEAGPVLLATQDPKTGQKSEIVVDNDSLQGDQDDIELSFRTYKDNQVQRTAFKPRVVLSLKMESGIWTLNDIAITINLPLADPDLLQRITDGMKARAVAGGPQIHMLGMGQIPSSNFGGDASTLAAVHKILAAETSYAASYPAVGYTCTLSDLDGFGAAEANEHQAMLISSGLASGKHLGYIFSLSGCTGTPAASFHLTVAPIGNSYGRRAFCSDQSGAIRSSADGSAATCLSSGTPVP